MRTAYFDCFAGAGGDMIVASLLDAGCDWDALRAELEKLPVGPCRLRREPVRRGSLGGTQFLVEPGEAQPPHRHLTTILEMIDQADLPNRVAERSKAVFHRLGAAEAKVHRTDAEQVHFHEVGAVDTIVDVVGACTAADLLEIDRILCSPVPLGWGTVPCAHGELPVPAPATAELLRDARAETLPGPGPGELTTPTAAAILTTLAEGFGPPPPMRLDACGFGAGSRQTSPVPNLLRVLIGSEDDEGQLDTVVELSANLDDCTGEIIGATIEKLLGRGCLDAWATPVMMKKSRPGWVLSALCAPADAAAAEQIILAETTTFGLRRRPAERHKLTRRFETVETPYGPVRMKVGAEGRRIVTASPEFADALAAAEAHGVPVKDVLAAAQRLWAQREAS